MMRPMTLSELQVPLQAQLTGGDREILRVSTDSRSLQQGDLFVALSGEHYDGHDYVAQVGDAGAAAAVVSHLVDAPLPQLCVTDTRQALG
ncbi:MAG TPA: UDP-N-acetylmuramoyl-tripeptide--D-alanyl-D-alanine ligase, partial [Halieaceae bacterium]|nr:UDP-N-acetylmuramoyl-tripeptide--D-alanyl-D-alanine ligase [Halieaceae bacterium]